MTSMRTPSLCPRCKQRERRSGHPWCTICRQDYGRARYAAIKQGTWVKGPPRLRAPRVRPIEDEEQQAPVPQLDPHQPPVSLDASPLLMPRRAARPDEIMVGDSPGSFFAA